MTKVRQHAVTDLPKQKSWFNQKEGGAECRPKKKRTWGYQMRFINEREPVQITTIEARAD